MITVLYLVSRAIYTKGSQSVVQEFLGVPKPFHEIHDTKITFISVLSVTSSMSLAFFTLFSHWYTVEFSKGYMTWDAVFFQWLMQYVLLVSCV